MSVPTTPSSADQITPTTSKNLDDACQDVEAKIGRTDNKASLLLAFNGAVLAGLAGIADKDLPAAAQLVGGAAVLSFGASAVLLLLVVRPNLGGRGRVVREGFPCWAQLSEEGLIHAMRQDTRAIRVQALSLIAVAKFERLARAVDLILAALALLLVAAVLAAIG
ncbi:Pycsar system effector family protein [Streptomyces sp. NPDC057099]|uniref:Pycsar system effector family protein n=1 Tax=Streptomyces sp. NPDC057099 TaxID=3346019 RepID=UPI003645F087